MVTSYMQTYTAQSCCFVLQKIAHIPYHRIDQLLMNHGWSKKALRNEIKSLLPISFIGLFLIETPRSDHSDGYLRYWPGYWLISLHFHFIWSSQCLCLRMRRHYFLVLWRLTVPNRKPRFLLKTEPNRKLGFCTANYEGFCQLPRCVFKPFSVVYCNFSRSLACTSPPPSTPHLNTWPSPRSIDW